MATVTVAECEPPNNGAHAVNNCGQPDSGQRRPTAATQTDGQPPIVCNGILCYLYNKMDCMVHDTLVKLCADHFNANDTDTAKQLVYECDEVQKLGLRQGRRRQGPNRGKNNIEDILCALHKCTKGLPIFAVSDLSTLPQLDINDIDFGYILSEFRAMRAEMTELRRDVNDVKSKGADKVQWPTINSKVTANDDTPESNATSGETTGSMIGATIGATSGASVGSTIGATIGATSGASVGSTIGATIGATSGATVGSTIGATIGATSGATSGASVGSTIGATSGATSGASVGSTIGATSGATSGASVGSTIGATSGATSGASVGSTIGSTIGATIGATSGPTSGASVGSTIGSTIGATIGATSGPTSGASVGSTIGATSGATSGASVGSTIGATSGARTGRTTYPNGGKTRRTPRADDDGYVTVTRRKSSKVGFNNQMKRPVIGTRTHGNTLKVSCGRFVSVFVSRLDPSVSCDTLSDYIYDVHSINAKCEQLVTKYNTYASFKVDVTCNDISTFLDADKWPQGVYLRKFFNNKK